MPPTAAGSALLFGSYDARLHPRVAVLREGLVEHGWAVAELNAPLGSSTADKVDAAGSAAAAARLLTRVGRSWWRLAAGRRHAGRPDVVVVGYLGHLDVHLAKLLFPRSTIVLDHLVGLADTVRDRRLGGGPKLRVLAALDRWAIRAADVVVVDTAQQASGTGSRRPTVVVPVGATDDWERAAAAAAIDDAHRDAADRDLRVVFFGLFTPLQGAPTIGTAIAELADEPVTFTMVGSGQDRAAAERAAGPAARATWLDWVDADELPRLVAGHDVCLGIFDDGPKADRVVPTKVFQGMAAGCAVVTGDTTAARSLVGDDVELVPVADHHALAKELRRLSEDRAHLAASRRRSATAARRFRPGPATAALHRELVRLRRARATRPPPLTLNAWLRWDVIEEEVRRAAPSTVAEVGPGEGAVACRLAAGRTYTGVERSDRTRAITAARLERNGTPGRVVASFEDVDDDERFDLVCAFEVLEHIDDDLGALREWAARVAPGGTLIVSTPAGPDRMGPHDALAGHLRRYSPEGMAALLRDAGLVDVRVTLVGDPVGFGLEAVRDALARRRTRALGAGAPGNEELTEASSSIRQPPAWAGPVTRLLSAPARAAQRRSHRRGGTRGTGLVAAARVPR